MEAVPGTIGLAPSKVIPQVARHLPAAVERVLQRQFVHPPHQGQVLRALFPRRVVHRRAVDAKQRALEPDAQRAAPLDQPLDRRGRVLEPPG